MVLHYLGPVNHQELSATFWPQAPGQNKILQTKGLTSHLGLKNLTEKPKEEYNTFRLVNLS